MVCLGRKTSNYKAYMSGVGNFFYALFKMAAIMIQLTLKNHAKSLRSYDWLKIIAPLSRPIRSKTKTNRDLPARVLPRLALAGESDFWFWSV